MAAVCEVCGKQPVVRHEPEPLAPAHQAALEPQHPAGAGHGRTARPKRLHVCTSCIRAGKVTKPPRRVPTAG